MAGYFLIVRMWILGAPSDGVNRVDDDDPHHAVIFQIQMYFLELAYERSKSYNVHANAS